MNKETLEKGIKLNNHIQKVEEELFLHFWNVSWGRNWNHQCLNSRNYE